MRRLGLSLPRQRMRSVFDATLGNPLFALEVGRKLIDEAMPAGGEDLPLPDAVEDLLGTRVAALPPQERRLLLAAALTVDLRVGQLAGLGGRESLDSAVERGVVVVDGDHVRAAHPLLAAAATQRSRAAERRELHGVLATVVDREELRFVIARSRRPRPMGRLRRPSPRPRRPPHAVVLRKRRSSSQSTRSG